MVDVLACLECHSDMLSRLSLELEKSLRKLKRRIAYEELENISRTVAKENEVVKEVDLEAVDALLKKAEVVRLHTKDEQRKAKGTGCSISLSVDSSRASQIKSFGSVARAKNSSSSVPASKKRPSKEREAAHLEAAPSSERQTLKQKQETPVAQTLIASESSRAPVMFEESFLTLYSKNERLWKSLERSSVGNKKGICPDRSEFLLRFSDRSNSGRTTNWLDNLREGLAKLEVTERSQILEKALSCIVPCRNYESFWLAPGQDERMLRNLNLKELSGLTVMGSKLGYLRFRRSFLERARHLVEREFRAAVSESDRVRVFRLATSLLSGSPSPPTLIVDWQDESSVLNA